MNIERHSRRRRIRHHFRYPLDGPKQFHQRRRANPISLSIHLGARPESVDRLKPGRFRNLDFPLSLSELAKELEIPQRTLSHVCKQVFGESPMRLYLRIRLQAARNFLFYEEFSIKAVSNACGFSYPAVFSRVFRAQFAQTPREFRARLRKDQNMAMRPEILLLPSFVADAWEPLVGTR